MSRVYLSPPDIRKEDFAALDAVLASKWVAPAGPHLKLFEETLAKKASRAHALAVNSGTAALHLALKVLDVKPGDCVICPTFTFAASANPIRYCGAEPVFVDSEPETWNICRKYEIPIIEDAAEALGASYKSRPAGGMGDLSFFSFNGNKIITTSGGGMLLSDNAGWIERAYFLATQAREPELHYEHTEVGYNYRLTLNRIVMRLPICLVLLSCQSTIPNP